MPIAFLRCSFLSLLVFLTTAPATPAAPATQPAPTATGELLRDKGDKGDEKPSAVTKPAAAFDPTDAYDLQTIEGWPIRVNQRLLREQPELAAKTLELLRFQLFQITRVVPPPALEKIRTVTIWVEQRDPLFPCMCYHSSVDWVSGHGLNPQKAHGVELSNPQTFLDWTHEQPWMVFHELAHAYHDQFMSRGFENAEVTEAYRSAKEGKLYDAVLRSGGRTERAYAMTNPMEYFAECSEAFFGTNDFFPFVRAELKVHDPKGYEVLSKSWGVRTRGGNK